MCTGPDESPIAQLITDLGSVESGAVFVPSALTLSLLSINVSLYFALLVDQ